MESVIRPTFVYLFVLVLLRLTGRRTLAQITTFDFVLLLIISEACQQAPHGRLALNNHVLGCSPCALSRELCRHQVPLPAFPRE